MAEQPFTEEDVQLVAGLLPLLVAQEHGCLPEECDNTSDVTPDNWRSIANSIVAALAEAGRLLPHGLSLKVGTETTPAGNSFTSYDLFRGDRRLFGGVIATPAAPVGTEETPDAA